MRVGLDVARDDGFAMLRGLRVGLIANPTSVDEKFRHAVDLVSSAPGVKLEALFGPEHGLRGEAQYMVPVDDVARDERTGVPVHSLYGHTFASLSPKPEHLGSLDALVFDIQDVGSRYYTYIYTMALAMKAAAHAGLKFVVFDRPNPIGLDAMEGNIVGPEYRSFVGLYGLPNRHGLSAGEVARLLNRDEGWKADLQVVPCAGLRRAMRWADCNRHFVPPSPNMPTPDTALVYPGMCMLEGTNVSEGRGTTRPFEQFGAPWLRSASVADALNAEALPGVVFRPVAFTPTFDKFAGQSCEGAFIHVTDSRAFLPVLTGVAVVRTLMRQGEKHFAWRTDAYEFVDKIPAFDLLAGCSEVRTRLESGATSRDALAGFDGALKAFHNRSADVFLYG